MWNKPLIEYSFSFDYSNICEYAFHPIVMNTCLILWFLYLSARVVFLIISSILNKNVGIIYFLNYYKFDYSEWGMFVLVDIIGGAVLFICPLFYAIIYAFIFARYFLVFAGIVALVTLFYKKHKDKVKYPTNLEIYKQKLKQL